MKKITAIILLVALAVSLFACAKKETEFTKSMESSHASGSIWQVSTAVSTTAAVNGVIPAIPGSVAADNGVYTYITADTLYEHRFLSFGANEYTAEYFDEEFFKEYAVVILLINMDVGERARFIILETLGTNKFLAHVKRENDEKQNYAGTQVMLIPVPRASVLAADAEIYVEITR